MKSKISYLAVGNGDIMRSMGYIDSSIHFKDSEIRYLTRFHIVENSPCDMSLCNNFFTSTETVKYARPNAITRDGSYTFDSSSPLTVMVLTQLVAARKPSLLSRLKQCFGR